MPFGSSRKKADASWLPQMLLLAAAVSTGADAPGSPWPPVLPFPSCSPLPSFPPSSPVPLDGELLGAAGDLTAPGDCAPWLTLGAAACGLPPSSGRSRITVVLPTVRTGTT